MKKLINQLVAAIALLPCAAWAGDAVASAEPSDAPIAQFAGGGKESSVAWYFTSDSPRRERQIAQTVQIAQDGEARQLALALAGDSLAGLGDDASYQLTVYESSVRPDRQFISRDRLLVQEGVVRDGEGGWLVISLDEAVPLKAMHFYTFVLQFATLSAGNRVVLAQSEGDSGSQFRWHREGRNSWVPSPLSLHYRIY